MFKRPTKHLMSTDIDVYILVSQVWKNAPFNNLKHYVKRTSLCTRNLMF